MQHTDDGCKVWCTYLIWSLWMQQHTTGGCKYLSNFSHYMRSWPWMSYMVCIRVQHTAGGCIIRGHGHEWVPWCVYATHDWWLHYTWAWSWMSSMVCVCNTRLVVALYVGMVMNEFHGVCMQHTTGGCIIRGHGHEWVTWCVYATHGWWLHYTWAWAWMSYMVCVCNTRLVVANTWVILVTICGHGHEWVIWFVYVCNTRLVVALYVVMVMNELHGVCMQHTTGGCIIRGHGHEWVTWCVYVCNTRLVVANTWVICCHYI